MLLVIMIAALGGCPETEKLADRGSGRVDARAYTPPTHGPGSGGPTYSEGSGTR